MSQVIYYATDERLTPKSTEVLKRARALSYGDEEVDFEEVEAGVGALNFGFFPDLPEDAIRTMSFSEAAQVPNAQYIIAAAMNRYQGTFEYRSPKPGASILWMDIEAGSVDDMWNIKPRDYFRLGQYAWDEDPVEITEDYDEIIDIMESADVIVAHQGHNFDWTALYGADSMRPLELARDGRLFDTKLFASTNFPAPSGYKKRNGHWQKDASAPANAKHGWFSLDNLAYQFGVPGKEGDLKALAKEFGGFGKIPLDDKRYRNYARQDVVTLRELGSAMLQFGFVGDYDWREQRDVGGINAQMARNGVRLDVEVATERIETLANRKAELLADLEANYGFPTEGKAPWSSKKGRDAIIRILNDNGIDPETTPGWPQGKTGPSLGGKVLTQFLDDTDSAELGRSLAELSGQRPLAQQALDYLQDDGKVHPEYDTFQRSGRTSVTQPGLTTWGNRNEKLRIEKSYFVPDNDDELLIEFDFSQADARIVAAYSGDEEFAKRFEPGADSHEISGRLMYGDDVYEASMPDGWEDNPKVRKENPIRHTAKALGHAYAFRARAKRLSIVSGLPLETAQKFVDAMDTNYAGVLSWQTKVEREGMSGFVVNDWGRMLPIEEGRSYNQAPAMYGQSGTRELMVDALGRMLQSDIRLIKWLKMTVHDALIFSIPKRSLGWAVPEIERCMTFDWKPKEGGRLTHFPADKGSPALTWAQASH